MSCNSNCYLPIPPRAWSRVQNNCSLFDENTYSGTALVPLPYSGRLVPASTLYLEYAMLNKGNVLQYKKNSSNLTKQQRYAQIAKGKWVNRNTTWATQSTRGYTNPNNQSLQRVNSVNITLDGQPTLAPVTCPKPFTPVYEPLPATSSSGANPEVIPPPPPPPTVNTGTELPPTIIEPPVEPIVIRDLGNLVCGTEENVCTGEIIRQLVADNCHPTSDSDVPGPLMELCWNDGNPTWYPRQRYVMTNSGNKWPVNATLVSSITPLPSDIISISNVENVITLIWTFDPKCLPVNDFIIYENGIPVKIVSGNTFTTSFTVQNCATYTFYIVGTNGSVVSDPSNTVSIDIYVPLPPTITLITSTCNGGITINWETLFAQCFPVDYYTIYQDGLPIAISNSSPYLVTSLPVCTSYSYYITTTYTNGDVSTPSNTVTTEIFPCAPTISLGSILADSIVINWTAPSSTCTINNYYIYQSINNISYTQVGTTNNVTFTFTATGLSPLTKYYFYVTSVGGSNESNPSNIIDATTTDYSTPVIQSITSCYKTATISWTNVDNALVDYYIFNQTGSPSITNLNIGIVLSYATTNLTNGNSYTFTIKAVYAGGAIQKISNPVNYTQPLANTFYSVAGGVETSDPTYYIVTYTINGDIDFFCDIPNVEVVICGGGGGGAGGRQPINPGTTGRGGGGGGGGGIYTNPGYLFTVNLYGIQVGLGGLRGDNGPPFPDGSSGGSSSISNTTLPVVSGGGGGISIAGTGGTSGSAGIAGTSGGNGGQGGNCQPDGLSPTSGIVGGNSNDLNYSGGGGGGFGGSGSGGGSGGNGTGGSGGSLGILPASNGSIGVKYGSGGGGGANDGEGGNGNDGIVILYIPKN